LGRLFTATNESVLDFWTEGFVDDSDPELPFLTGVVVDEELPFRDGVDDVDEELPFRGTLALLILCGDDEDQVVGLFIFLFLWFSGLMKNSTSTLAAELRRRSLSICDAYGPRSSRVD